MKPRQERPAPKPKPSQNDKLCSVSQAESEGKYRAEESIRQQNEAGIK